MPNGKTRNENKLPFMPAVTNRNENSPSLIGTRRYHALNDTPNATVDMRHNIQPYI
jgi:hypothetical protein